MTVTSASRETAIYLHRSAPRAWRPGTGHGLRPRLVWSGAYHCTESAPQRSRARRGEKRGIWGRRSMVQPACPCPARPARVPLSGQVGYRLERRRR
jgi:hypothetical protein